MIFAKIGFPDFGSCLDEFLDSFRGVSGADVEIAWQEPRGRKMHTPRSKCAEQIKTFERIGHISTQLPIGASFAHGIWAHFGHRFLVGFEPGLGGSGGGFGDFVLPM